MSCYFLSLGSNLRPRKHLKACLSRLRENFEILRVSPIYETPPFGPAGSRPFWNAAVLLRAQTDRRELRIRLQKIETSLGRRRSRDKYAPRTIDIDLLPYRGYTKHPFVVLPMVEIAPDWKDPRSGKSMRQLARKFRREKRLYQKIRLSR